MASNKDKIKVLKAARKLIKCGAERYICLALMSIGEYRTISNRGYAATEYLQEYITKAIGCGYGSALEVWQDKHMKLKDRVGRDTRQDRLAWIDWMIASLEGRV